MDLGARIKAWREHVGLSQKELAAAVGVVPAAVCMWESSDYDAGPSRKNLAQLLELFRITMVRFYGPLPKAKRPTRKRAA